MSSLGQELLPGLYNDITLTHIATKLPWRAFNVLSSVSRTWQQAIQDRMVYAERIRCRSTETLIVVKHLDAGRPQSDRNFISLYSMREKAFYKLPPIPQFEGGISRHSQFISMDGKLYVLRAGFQNGQNMPAYVLDLAGQRHWEMCRSVPEPEREYSFNIGHGFHVTARKNCVVAGSENWYRSNWQECRSVQAVWRVEETESRGNHGPWIMLQGKSYLMLKGKRDKTHEIDVYDVSTKTLKNQHSIAWDEIKAEIEAALPPSRWPLEIFPSYVLPANNELFAVARWRKSCDHDPNNVACWSLGSCICGRGYCLVQSKGFGTGRKDIVWETAGSHRTWHFELYSSIAICPIQL